MHQTIKPFGQFLVEKDSITLSQLQEAVYAQNVSRLLIGQLAVAKGYMEDRDIDCVLRIQASSKKRFGEIAISKGLITEDQLLALLQTQSYNHIHIGRTLRELGYIQAEDLYSHMYEFKQLSLKDTISNCSTTSEIKKWDLANRVFRSFQKYLFAEGSFTRINSLHRELPSLDKMEFIAVQQHLSGNACGYICLIFPKIFAVVTSSSSISKFSKPSNSSEFIERFSELLCIQNYMTCGQLEVFGYLIKPGTTQNYMPQYTRVQCVRLDSMFDNIYMAYLVDAHSSAQENSQPNSG